MHVLELNPEFFIPFLIFAIPIIAVAGGITAGIIKTIGQQRLIELAQRERIAAIERGIDPSKLPPLPAFSEDFTGMYVSSHEYSRRRSQGLMIGGIITLAVGLSLSVLLHIVDREPNLWAVGLVPSAVGVALLLSAWLVRPRNGDAGPATPRAS